MLVEHRMTPNPVTVTTSASLKDTLDLLQSKPFRHLPVVDEAGKLAGIASERGLLHSSPTSSTTLSVFEVDYILSHTQVEQVMSHPVITVEPDLPIEEAARIMIDHRIGCLPVVEDDELVGIISDTDIFRVFAEGLGGGYPSLRVTVMVPEAVGSLAKLTNCMAEIGANIYSLGIFWGEKPEDRLVTLRLESVEEEAVIQSLEAADIEVVTIWKPSESGEKG